MNDVEKSVLDTFKLLVARRVPVYSMILFGSRARGDADPQSDMDVVVVVDGPVDPQAEDYVSDCAWEAGLERGLVVVPVVFSRDEWERSPHRHSSLVKAVQLEGIPV